MNSSIFKLLGTTIAFLCASVVISAAMWGLELSGHQLVPGHTVGNWMEQVFVMVAYAALAGLVADLLRAIAAIVWQRESMPRFEPKAGYRGRTALAK